MSLKRCRNIYTLSARQHFLKRRQQSDPFEKDPFKIQSYNFRYAERPSFPVATLQQRINDSSNRANNDCQTFFYNYSFPNTNVRNKRNDESGFNLTNFQDHRRKKFLQESSVSTRLRGCTNAVLPKLYENKILNIYNGAQNSGCSPNLVMKPTYMQNVKTSYNFTNNDNMNTRNDIQVKRSLTTPLQTRLHKTNSSPLSSIYLNRQRSLNSGCEININIKSLEDNSLQDNVNIKIKTDSLCRNLNIDGGKFNKNNSLDRFHSSETFVRSKNMSKYNIKCQENQVIARKKDCDRIKQLTSIYSSQVLKKSPTKRNNTSNERLPSFIAAAGLNNGYTTTRFDNLPFRQNNLSGSKLLLEKPKSLLNSKCNINNNLPNSPYNNFNSSSSSSSKRLHSVKQRPNYVSSYSLSPSPPATSNRSEFKKNVPLLIGSNAKLPINVNINVYADKLKLFNV